MVIPNHHYADLKGSYLFRGISERIQEYLRQNPDAKLLRLGIGDVSLPLCPAVIEAMHKAVEEQAHAETFQGYLSECGMDPLRETIAEYYKSRGIEIDADEVFVSSGASDELGDILHLFDRSTISLIMEPAYPAYTDANIMDGRPVRFISASSENGFLPLPDELVQAGLIYLCSPDNPTGAVYSHEQLKLWVDFANRNQAVILFDAAYEAFVQDPSLPRSIFEIPGAKTCAIEICSLSKTAGFTGTRLGYTILPKTLRADGMNFHDMWIRNRTTRTNGVSCILQKAGLAVFSPEGQTQIQENLQVYRNNAKCLMDALDEAAIWYCGGKNSPYIWMKCPYGYTSWEFFDRLLNEIQVIGTPGSGFGPCGEGYFRLSAFGDSEEIAEASRRLKQLLLG